MNTLKYMLQQNNCFFPKLATLLFYLAIRECVQLRKIVSPRLLETDFVPFLEDSFETRNGSHDLGGSEAQGTHPMDNL